MGDGEDGQDGQLMSVSIWGNNFGESIECSALIFVALIMI